MTLPDDTNNQPTKGDGSASKRPSVFISYAHETDDHKKKVYGLAASLRRDGFEILIDIEKTSGEDWPLWMQRQLEKADFVLCVCTAEYLARFDHNAPPNVGLGVGWEGGLIRRMLYEVKLENSRVFPMYFSETDSRHVPITLSGYDRFQLLGPADYENLMRKLTGNRRFKILPAEATFPPPDLSTEVIGPLFPSPSIQQGEVEPQKNMEGLRSRASIGSVIQLTQEITAAINQIVPAAFDELCVQLKFSATDHPEPRKGFLECLLKRELDDVIDAFAEVARLPTAKETGRSLRHLADRIIPLKFSEHFAARMAPLLNGGRCVFLEGVAGHTSIAECIAAHYDLCPLRLDSNHVGETAVQTFGLPNNGGGPDAVLKGAIEFLQDIINAVGDRFYKGSHPAPNEGRFEELCEALDDYGVRLRKREKRTVYMVVKMPDEVGKRDFLKKVVQLIIDGKPPQHANAPRVGGVRSVLFLELTKQFPADQRLYFHCIFSSRFE